MYVRLIKRCILVFQSNQLVQRLMPMALIVCQFILFVVCVMRARQLYLIYKQCSHRQAAPVGNWSGICMTMLGGRTPYGSLRAWRSHQHTSCCWLLLLWKSVIESYVVVAHCLLPFMIINIYFISIVIMHCVKKFKKHANFDL